MTEMGFSTSGPGDPVLAVQVNHEKSYAFVEVGVNSKADLEDFSSCFYAIHSSVMLRTLLLRWPSMASYSSQDL